ncbi:MAG: 16S rRNA (uracil(1498)-N(3))-methyltransferase [Mycoplasma sp.]
MQKVFAKKIVDDIVSISKEDEHHLLNVIRYKLNDQIIITNQAKKYLCYLLSIEPMRFKIIEEIKMDIKNEFEINVFQASIKQNHMEIAIIKACELNVDNFYIFKSELSQNNIQHNLERYKKLIKTASEQSNRINFMEIKIIDSKEELLEKIKLNEINIVADFKESDSNLFEEKIQPLNKIGIIVGPEGGFNKKDQTYFENNNIQYLQLTKTILRSETALITLIGIVSYVKLKGFKWKDI